MRKLQRLSAFLFAAILVLGLSIPVYAHDYVQMDKKGTITITMHVGDTAVGGGTLTMYRVGEVRENDGDYEFQPAGDFVSCGEPFEDVTSPTLADSLAKYASDKKITGVTNDINMDGSVTFTDLEVGLYLFVQNKAASGYNKADPFLVTLPYMQGNEQYSYNVDASPKVELEKEPESTTPPPAKPHEPTLPKTGQLNWPIPVLAVLGLLLFTAGWLMRFGQRKADEK